MICNMCKRTGVLHAFSDSNCKICGKEIATPHIPAHKICKECSTEHRRCQQCGERISCIECRFYDPGSMVCMYNCRVLAILSATKSAMDCEYFDEGKYSVMALESSNYK